MQQKRIISFISALWLLLVFTLSIAPKKYLHDVFSNHGDSCINLTAEKATTVGSFKTNCDVSNQVATVPFLLINNQYTVLLPAFSAEQNIPFLYYCFSTLQYNYALRGPPAV
jgi:hypothetical protein